MHADEAQRVSVGTGVTVAVIDSGVDAAHADLAGQVVDGPDLVDGDAVPQDDTGHGSHVAGIIAARRNDGVGIHGAAPGATILAIRALDAADAGDSTVLARAVDAAVAGGAQVINLSVSAGPNVVTELLPDSRLVRALDRAAALGVVIVAAAGNDRLPLCAQPVLATRILCVGAVTRGVTLASYTNFAVRVNLVAPGGEAGDGQDVVSVAAGGGWTGRAGTSQATPHVAAAAALLVARGLRGQVVIERLEGTAADLGAPGQDATYGYGLLDMGAALAGLGPAIDPDVATIPLTARVPARVRRATLRARGLVVRARAAQPGRVTVRVTSRGRLLARTARRVRGGVRTTLRARLTATGRRLLARGRRVRVLVRVTKPGAAPVRRRTTVR